jgi:hypothetical protein
MGSGQLGRRGPRRWKLLETSTRTESCDSRRYLDG